MTTLLQLHRTRVLPAVLRKPASSQAVTSWSAADAEADLRYTGHALARMSSLGFTGQDVLAAVTSPLWTRPNGPGHPADRTVCVGPDLLVVWQPASRTVITVLLRTGIPYRHGDHTREHPPTATTGIAA